MSNVPGCILNLHRKSNAICGHWQRNIATFAPISNLLDRLEAGEVLGDQIQGSGLFAFQVRVQNSDLRKGKRGGYRFIYYLKTPTQIILLTIYSKLEQSDISAEKIRRILKEFELLRCLNHAGIHQQTFGRADRI